MPVDATVAASARRIVERAAEMIDVEVDLVRGSYYNESPSYCGGRRVCAIGALWLAAGIQPSYITSGCWEVPGTGDSSNRRDRFLDDRPALRLAYDAVNAAARAHYDDTPDLHVYDLGSMDALLGESWTSELEALFEETTIDADGIRDVLTVAARALTTNREEAGARVSD